MLKCAFLIFVILTSSICEGKKKCSNIICPNSYILPNDTIATAYLRYIDNENYPESGICLDGKAICRIYGKDWGKPGVNRCACVEVNGFSEVVENTECAEGVPRCHPMIPIYKNEAVGDFYKRFGQTYKNNVVSNGCCPPNFVKSLLHPLLTGLNRKLCYCEPLPGKIVFNEGSVPVGSDSCSHET